MEEITKRLPKFKEKELAIFKNENRYFVVSIIEVIEHVEERRQPLKQDGMYGEPTGPMIDVTMYSYKVYFPGLAHTRLLEQKHLVKIENDTFFLDSFIFKDEGEEENV